MSRRVAFVLAGLGAGGAERVVAGLSATMAAEGWRVTVIAFDAPDDLVYHAFAPQVRLVRLAIPMSAGARSILQAMRRVIALRRMLTGEGFDVVVSFLTKINVISLLASVGLSVPLIVSERNNAAEQRMNPIWQFLLKRLYPRARAIVMQTERSKSCLPVAQRQRAIVIPNPISLPQPLPAASGERQICAVGRLEPQKGFDMLIDAFASVAAQHPDWTLRIWGEGPLRAALERQIRTQGLSEKVWLAGRSPTAGSWLDPGGIFVLSSRYEGFPNALAEAMAAGMAVVAFDCDFGPRELIRSEAEGLLVLSGDVGKLADSVASLMGDSRARRLLSDNAVASASRFLPKVICAKWVGLLDENSH